MQFLKQLLFQKAWLGSIIIGLSSGFILKNIMGTLLSGEAVNAPLYLIGAFFIILIIIFAFVSIFMVLLTPYKRTLMEKNTTKEINLKLPKLYSFADYSCIDVGIPYAENEKDGCIDDLINEEEGLPVPILNIEKFEIKLFDKNNEELKIKISTYLGKEYVLSIELEDPSDLKRIDSIEIKSPIEIEMSIQQVSYNGK